MVNSTAFLPELGVTALVLAAAVCDVRTRRIPNWLVAAGLVVALFTQCLATGLATGSLSWLAGGATGLALFLGLYLARGMGAGDVKLMAAVGAFCGPADALYIALASCLIGGLMAVCLIAAGNARRLGRSGLLQFVLLLPTGFRTAQATAGMAVLGTGIKVPYAVAIAAGTVMVTWWKF
jgi:prepilin peptidase CpaA